MGFVKAHEIQPLGKKKTKPKPKTSNRRKSNLLFPVLFLQITCETSGMWDDRCSSITLRDGLQSSTLPPSGLERALTLPQLCERIDALCKI